MNPNDMTAQQAADWCAKDDGWNRPGTPLSCDQPASAMGQAMSRQWTRGCWWMVEAGALVRSRNHPHPHTLDGAAKAMPEGWWWSRYETPAEGVKWHAGPRNGFASVCVYDTGDELRDRWLLVVLCRIAAKESTNGKA